MDYTILPMEQCHINGICELERQCFSKPWSREDIEAQLGNSTAHFLAAAAGENVIGYVGIYEIMECCETANLAVSPEHRKKGIGEALMNAACEGARERGCLFITLEVRESNLPAISLYKKLGFEQAGRRKSFYSCPVEDGIIMTKQL